MKIYKHINLDYKMNGSLFSFFILLSLLIYTLQEFHHCCNNKLLAITRVRAFQPNPSSPITMALSLLLSNLH